MEAEAREMLPAGLQTKSAPRLNLAESIQRYVQPFGGVELAIRRGEPFAALRSLVSDLSRQKVPAGAQLS
jgi:hypothetical protein